MSSVSAEIDRSLWKISFFGALAVLASFFFGYAAQQVRTAPVPSALVWAGVGLALWLSFSLLVPYVIKSASVAALIALLQSVIVGLFLFGGKSPGLFFGAVFFLTFFLLMAFGTGRSEIRNALRIHFFKIGRGVVSVLVLGMNLFFALVVVFALRGEEVRIPQPFLGAMLRSSAPIVQRYVPGFSLEMNVDAFFESFAKSRLPEGTPQFAVDRMVSDFVASIESQTKVTIDQNATVLQALDEIANTKLKDFSAKNQTLTLLVLAGLVFFTLAGLGFLVQWVILAVGFFLFQIFYASRFLHMEFETADKEIIVV